MAATLKSEIRDMLTIAVRRVLWPCFNCEDGLIHNPYWYDGPMVCPYCLGSWIFKKPEINHRQWKAGAWGYWRSWSIHCLKCDKMLDYRNAAQPDKCPACGYGGEE